MKYTHSIKVQEERTTGSGPSAKQKPRMVDLNIIVENGDQAETASIGFVASDENKDKWPQRIADMLPGDPAFWLKEAAKMLAEVNKALV